MSDVVVAAAGEAVWTITPMGTWRYYHVGTAGSPYYMSGLEPQTISDMARWGYTSHITFYSENIGEEIIN